jgi:UDP-N-acetyl-D-mannosaminuronate dehydrogenase
MGAAGASAASLTLIERCGNRTALVGVIGLGYVGLPLALRSSEAGFRVIGFDIDRAKAEAIPAAFTGNRYRTSFGPE